MKECPYCKRSNDDGAQVCVHCRGELSAAEPQEPQTVTQEHEEVYVPRKIK